MSADQVDLNKSPFDRNTFIGRVRYFAWITDPRLSFIRKKQLLEARDLLHSYRCLFHTELHTFGHWNLHCLLVTMSVEHQTHY